MPWPEIADILRAECIRCGLVSADAEAAHTIKPKRERRGRKLDTDSKTDKKIADAWRDSGCKTYADFASASGEAERSIKLAVERHRKR